MPKKRLGLDLQGFILTLLVLQQPAPAAVAAPPGNDSDDDEQAIVVTATRAAVLMKDEPIHVEAVPTEEIEENLTESPGSVSAIFFELPGIHIESVAPGLGGAGVQLRGMPARDTLILIDGLPLLGAETGAFDVLQTPPLDLARAEVIKGTASALYGSSALGGVLNLVSRLPDSGSSVLASADSRGGRQGSAFIALPGTQWSATLMAATDSQSREDLNPDGWADIPFHQRYTLRPRVWLQEGEGDSLFLTAGITDEERRGGTLPGSTLPDGQSFADSLHTWRYDSGIVSHWSLSSGDLDGRLSFTSNHQDSTFGLLHTTPVLSTVDAEESWSNQFSQHHVILGAAFVNDSLRDSGVAGVNYNYNVPAVFAQDEWVARNWLTVAASTRVDFQNTYGTFVSPHLSVLLHSDGPWSLRAAVAGGFAAPTIQVEEIQSTSLATLLPLRDLHAERATTTSMDLRWASGAWDVNTSVFTSEIHDPLEAVSVGNRFMLVNDPGPRRAPGAEVVVMYRQGPLETLGSWTRIQATQRPGPGIPEGVPLVPGSNAQIGSILKLDQRGRVGLEAEYTGPQSLEDDPYRSSSPGLVEFGALAEIRFGKVRVFANAMNFTNVHQTHWDPLLRPTPGPGGDPTTDVWAPIAGRTFNGGVRVDL